MTSVRAAGYSSMGRRLSTGNQGWLDGQTVPATVDVSAVPPLESKPEDSSEERIKNMEKKVGILLIVCECFRQIL